MGSLSVGPDLLEQIEMEAEEAVLDTVTFYTSALHSEGLADMKNYLLAQAPRRQWRLALRDPDAPDEEDEDEENAREEAELDSLLQSSQGTGVDPNSVEGRAFLDRLLGEKDFTAAGSRTVSGVAGSGGGIAMRPQSVTGQSRKQLVEQFVLEALMVHLHDEIPYEAVIRCTDIEAQGPRADKVRTAQCAVCSVQCAVWPSLSPSSSSAFHARFTLQTNPTPQPLSPHFPATALLSITHGFLAHANMENMVGGCKRGHHCTHWTAPEDRHWRESPHPGEIAATRVSGT